MQNTTGVALVTTHLAVTDRRSLSQAWYSALHLAEHAPRPHAHVTRDGRITAHAHRARSTPADSGGNARSEGRAAPAGRGAARERNDAAAAGTDRRSPKTQLARRIERALVRSVPRGAPSSIAVSAGDGRVRLLVRSDGARTRVIALCTGALRDRVERALAHARFALAARGVRMETA